MSIASAVLMASTPLMAAEWPALDAPPTALETPASQDAAVLVGVEDYAFAPDVPGARQNVDAWYLHLRKHRGVPIDHITLLRDGEATREAIDAGLTAALGRVGPDGTLWVVFVGHGAPAPDRADGLLVGADARVTPRSLAERAVGRRALLGRLEDGPQARALVVLDACFSGFDRSGGSLVAGLQPLVPLQSAAPGERTVVFTAAGDTEFAGPLPGGARPAYSYLLLGALRGWADADGDARVTVDEAHGYTRRALGALVTDREQTPGVFGRIPDPVVGQGSEAGPDLDAMRLARAAVAPPLPAPTVPMIPVAPAAPAGAFVRVQTRDEDLRFSAIVTTPDGGRHACPQPIEIDRPCLLDGVAPGTAAVSTRGDVRARAEFGLPMGSTVVEVRDLPTWPYWVGGALMVAGSVGFGTFFGLRSSCDDDPTCDNEGLYLGLGVGSFFVGNGVGGGLLGWALWEGLKAGFDEVEVHSVPTRRAGVRLGVSPTGATLTVPW